MELSKRKKIKYFIGLTKHEFGMVFKGKRRVDIDMMFHADGSSIELSHLCPNCFEDTTYSPAWGKTASIPGNGYEIECEFNCIYCGKTIHKKIRHYPATNVIEEYTDGLGWIDHEDATMLIKLRQNDIKFSPNIETLKNIRIQAAMRSMLCA